MKKLSIYSIGFILAITLIVISGLFSGKEAGAATADIQTTFQSAATSSAITVGPQQNIQVVASSSLRTYLYISNEATSSGSSNIYCNPNADKPAGLGTGIKLGTSTTQTYYEFASYRGNLYVGGLRCTSAASTTMTVVEFRRP